MLKTILLTGMALACISSAEAGSFVFSKIEVPGNTYSYVNAINKANTVVGNFQSPKQKTRAFAWANGVTTLVKLPGETDQDEVSLAGVDTRGIAVGSSSITKPKLYSSFTYNLNTAKATSLESPAGYLLSPSAVSNNDIIVGTAYPSSSGNSVCPMFVKRPATPVTLSGPGFPPGDIRDVPSAVAPSGEIVGVGDDDADQVTIPFSYLNGTYTRLTPPEIFPEFVNDQGVITGFYNNGQDGFVLRGSKLERTDVVLPAGQQAFANNVVGITATGDLLGYYSSFDEQSHVYLGTHGFIRHNGIWSTFGVPGALETYVTKINEQGSVAGYYTDARGVEHAFVGVCTADQVPCTQ